MNGVLLEDVMKRLARVERENQRLKLGGLALLGLLGALVLMGQASPPKIVEAERFVVRDAVGTVRAVMGAPEEALRRTIKMDEHGVLLALYNTRGNVRAVLGVGAEGTQRVEVPRLELMDASGGPRVDLNVGQAGPGLYLADERAMGRVALEMPRRMPALILQDPSTKAQIVLGVGEGGRNALAMTDAQGRLRASLYAATPDAGVRLYDAQGTLRIALGRSAAGGAEEGLTLYDLQGTWRAMLDVRERGAVFDLRNSYGGLLNRPEHP